MSAHCSPPPPAAGPHDLHPKNWSMRGRAGHDPRRCPTPGTSSDRRGRAPLIDPIDRSTANPITPRTGEGMTGSPSTGLPTAGHTGTDERHAPRPPSTARRPRWIFFASHIVCRTSAGPKAHRRYAVALRASLGPDATSARLPGAKNPQPRSPTPLTHHAPSGMTCTVCAGVRWSRVQLQEPGRGSRNPRRKVGLAGGIRSVQDVAVTGCRQATRTWKPKHDRALSMSCHTNVKHLPDQDTPRPIGT
jgi:hypothetical protein